MTETERVSVKALAFGNGCICEREGGGKKVFVSGVIPNETVLIAITKAEKNFDTGALQEVVTASPSRRTAPCPYFGTCGGCSLQHMTFEEQHRSKIDMIETMLRRHGGVELENGVTSISEGLPEFSYRRRVTFHLNDEGEIGFYRAGSIEVVPIAKCIISEEPINAVLTKLRPNCKSIAGEIAAIEVDVSEETPRLIFKARFASVKSGRSLSPETIAAIGNLARLGTISVQIQGKNFEIRDGSLWAEETNAGHFSQVNRCANERLVSEVLAKIQNGKVTELYAGAGNFSVPLAKKGLHITAVESNASLVNHGIDTAKNLKLNNIEFKLNTCENFVKQNRLSEIVLLDPPRAGVKEVIRFGNWKTVEEIIYISCDLPSLARDLKLFKEQGLIVQEVKFLDMFPQTHHVELVAHLKRI